MNKMVEKVAIALQGCDPSAGASYEDSARAVIEAMREPTDEMIAAGDMPDCDNPQKDAEGVYRNMIDAALTE